MAPTLGKHTDFVVPTPRLAAATSPSALPTRRAAAAGAIDDTKKTQTRQRIDKTALHRDVGLLERSLAAFVADFELRMRAIKQRTFYGATTAKKVATTSKAKRRQRQRGLRGGSRAREKKQRAALISRGVETPRVVSSITKDEESVASQGTATQEKKVGWRKKMRSLEARLAHADKEKGRLQERLGAMEEASEGEPPKPNPDPDVTIFVLEADVKRARLDVKEAATREKALKLKVEGLEAAVRRTRREVEDASAATERERLMRKESEQRERLMREESEQRQTRQILTLKQTEQKLTELTETVVEKERLMDGEMEMKQTEQTELTEQNVLWERLQTEIVTANCYGSAVQLLKEAKESEKKLDELTEMGGKMTRGGLTEMCVAERKVSEKQDRGDVHERTGVDWWDAWISAAW